MKAVIWLICFGSALLNTGAQTDGRETATNVSFPQLVRDATRFNGKRVSIVAYFDGTDGASLRASKGTGPQAGDVFLDLSPSLQQELISRKFFRGYVHVVGTFQHVDLTPIHRRPVAGDPNRNVVTQPLGFGGSYPNQITNITRFTSASRPKD